jgi:quercetin dioxygenase-like cupin family protein/alkylhydroperoxidase/carboxymuconolactone decarboxylase family protein YurZ
MKTICLSFALVLFGLTNHLNAQQPIQNPQTLDQRQQAIVTISAFTAKGDMLQLQKALHTGLDAGLTVNEIKEVLIQLYAYTGFPRSLNALNTFLSVLKERQQKGTKDELGEVPSPLPTGKTKLQLGTELQTKLVGQPVKGEIYVFAPAIDQFLKEHLFADIFGRDNLDWKTREIATIAALASLGGADNQLRSHFGVGMYNGLTAGQLEHLVTIIQSEVGTKEGSTAKAILQNVLGQPATAPAQPQENTLFPKGEKITNNNFTGNAWLQQLIATDSSNQIQVGSVTFEPGARTNWHSHPAGQILLATDGVGYYQEKGSPKRLLRKGDVVTCPPNVPHWHGASHDQPFVQIAITNSKSGPPVWLQPVSEQEYNSNQ